MRCCCSGALHPVLPTTLPKAVRANLHFSIGNLHNFCKKKNGSPQPNAKRLFARVKGLHNQPCHGLGVGARQQTLTQELSAVPQSALNQQVEKSPLAPSPHSSTHTEEPPGQDFSSLPIFHSSCPLRAAQPQLGSRLLPGGGSPGRDARL